MKILLNLLNSKMKRKILLVIYVIISIVAILFVSKLNIKFDEIDLLTYYTFMIGFHIQGYVSINMTNKAEKLKKIGKFDNIVNLYSNVIFINIIGLCFYIFSVLLDETSERITLLILVISLYYIMKLAYNVILFFKISD